MGFRHQTCIRICSSEKIPYRIHACGPAYGPMEKMGIVGPAEGAKPREILMTKDKVSEMFMNMENSKEEEQQ